MGGVGGVGPKMGKYRAAHKGNTGQPTKGIQGPNRALYRALYRALIGPYRALYRVV